MAGHCGGYEGKHLRYKWRMGLPQVFSAVPMAEQRVCRLLGESTALWLSWVGAPRLWWGALGAKRYNRHQ
jgi:hypothetical protein